MIEFARRPIGKPDDIYSFRRIGQLWRYPKFGDERLEWHKTIWSWTLVEIVFR